MNDTAPPIGRPLAEARERRAVNATYRAERDRRAPNEAIARQVLALRLEHGLTQEHLAQRVGTSHSQIARLESGHYRTSVATLERIAQAFDRELRISFVTPTSPD